MSDNPKQHSPSRRSFLGKAGVGAGALLIGHAFDRGTGLAQNIAVAGSQYQTIYVRTHEWYGDILERLDVPRDWEVEVAGNKTADEPVMNTADLRAAIQNPIGTKRLAEIAEGKKTATILFDDLTRPTPSDQLAPLLIEELKLGGIKDENILFINMLGTHWAMTHPQVERKLGKEIVYNYDWMNHNIIDNCEKLGTTSDGYPVEVNYFYYHSDVKVAMGNLKKHGAPGYSGGAKAIIPGVSSLNAIEHFHSNPLGGRLGNIYHNDCRKNMDEYARISGLDFITQTCSNPDRKPIKLWAGDVTEAFRAGMPEAVELYQTAPAAEADVVIANKYPYSIDEWQMFDWANWTLKEGGTAVAIMNMPLGRLPIHYWNERKRGRRLNGRSYFETDQNDDDPVRKAGEIIIYSQYLQERDMHYAEGRVKLVRDWDQVLDILEKRHGSNARCVVYPYVGIQHEPLEVDSP